METKDIAISRIRTELAAQQAVCQKMKLERDQLYSDLQDSKEEIKYVVPVPMTV